MIKAKDRFFKVVLGIFLGVTLFVLPSFAETDKASGYQDFLGQFQNAVDHFDTTFSYATASYDEKVVDLERAYKELSLKDPSAEFITKVSAEYHYDTKTFEVNVDYDYDSATCTKLYHDAMKKVDQIAAEIFKPNMTDYEKIRAAHDYVITHVQYDEAGRSSSEGHEYENLFTTAVLDGKAVCGGYSWFVKVLLDHVGIGSQLVIGTLELGDGTSGGHAWNIVWLNGKPYQVDATNDDLGVDLPSYGYFMVNDALMVKNHSWDRAYYPVCDDGSYEFYNKNKLWLADSQTVVNVLKEKMKNRGKVSPNSAGVVFRVLYPEAFDKKWVEDVVKQATQQSTPKWLAYTYEYVLQGDIRYIKISKLK